VDTPGVLSGEKQRTQRSYDFTGVISWFAAKCDLILLLFDPHKLDISDEFKRVIYSLRGHDDKIRVVLNKADQIDTQQVRQYQQLNLYRPKYFRQLVFLILAYLCALYCNTAAHESLWSTDVVFGKSSEYSRSCTCIYWVS
jgi:GTPase Era involved in 16S rRNA processing